MSQTPPPPDAGASQPEQRRPHAAATRIAIGVLLAAYYLRVLVAVARHFPENLYARVRWVTAPHGCLVWLRRYLAETRPSRRG